MATEQTPSGAWRFTGFTLDLSRHALLGSDGAEVPLRPKSFALLCFLVENARLLLEQFRADRNLFSIHSSART